MKEPSYYEILGVSKESKEEDIKKAYKKLVSEYHPDKNPDNADNADKFKKINEAYSILGNPQKKAEYDNKYFRPNFGYQKDIFEDLFKPFSRNPSETNYRKNDNNFSSQGEDSYIECHISFCESFLGTKRNFPFLSLESCNTCNGMGARPGTRFVNCGSCGGTGFVHELFHVSSKKCPVCDGKGSRPLITCLDCSGRGRTATEKSILVAIPSGVKTNDTLRVSGKGKPGDPPGDLYISIIVSGIPNYMRNGDDIITSTKIPLEMMVHGGKMEITTPWGKTYDLSIPPNTDSGEIITLKNAGFKSQTGTGDMQVSINPIIPKVLSPRAKLLFSELMEEISRQ